MNKIVVSLRGQGNPDFSQFSDVAPTLLVWCQDKEEAKKVVMNYQAYWDLGGGNCGLDHGTCFYVDGDAVDYMGRFSYNGRYWPYGEDTHRESVRSFMDAEIQRTIKKIKSKRLLKNRLAAKEVLEPWETENAVL